jgi:prolipoprotein diacylglyceryltransferase
VACNPSLVYDAIAPLLVLIVVVVLLVVLGRLTRGALTRPDGRVFVVGLALWSVGRAVVASTWRDPNLVGPLRAEQLIDLVVILACVVVIALLARRPLELADEPERMGYAREATG